MFLLGRSSNRWRAAGEKIRRTARIDSSIRVIVDLDGLLYLHLATIHLRKKSCVCKEKLRPKMAKALGTKSYEQRVILPLG